MTAPATSRQPEPIHLDTRDVELVVTVTRGGAIEIHHQADNENRADRAKTRLAQHFREVIPNRAIQKPAAGRRAIACGSCAVVVDLEDLRWRNRRSLQLGCIYCTPEEDR